MTLNSEQIVRKAYQIAEDMDLTGWVAAFTEDGTFTDESIGVTYRGPDELPVQVDPGDVVAALIADPRVRIVNFTGSTSIGRIIGVQAAQHLKPAVLELGGKNPLIILEDADPDLAVDAAVFGAFMNSGQICMSTDRIIIHHSLVETFIPR